MSDKKEKGFFESLFIIIMAILTLMPLIAILGFGIGFGVAIYEIGYQTANWMVQQ